MSKPGRISRSGRESAVPRRRGKWTAHNGDGLSRIVGSRAPRCRRWRERHGVRANLLSAWRRQEQRVASGEASEVCRGQGKRGAGGRVDRDRSGGRVCAGARDCRWDGCCGKCLAAAR